ncbi:thioesterase family [Pyrenophora seminiperda CCB06]|uniref:Thioesterase family n=1 Tax=Pyrenophora seminiperda CCB06 TaxID=1302712 RepID=A0A3M7M936_9PLEO|nr:thioesterase family [Pyrenophora seminiperda CCB06]
MPRPPKTVMSRARIVLNRVLLTCSSYRTARQSFRTIHHHDAQHANLPLALQSRMRWSYLWYASILALGITTGLGARHFAAPLGLPEPGSWEDTMMLESLGRDIDNLDIVKSLRSQSYNHNTDAALRSGPGLSSAPVPSSRKISAYKDWMEVDINLGRHSEGKKKDILGVLSGTRGFGVQRAFWNAQTREMVAVVWMGGGMSGWPGVAHGGAIAIFFEDIMARMVTGPEGAFEPLHRPCSVSLTYAKPTHSLDFYIVRARFSKPKLAQSEPPPEPEAQATKLWLGWLSPQKDLSKKTSSVGSNEEIVATLETVSGDLCVKAKGEFNASTGKDSRH